MKRVGLVYKAVCPFHNEKNWIINYTSAWDNLGGPQ
jgi:hypothetical protein